MGRTRVRPGLQSIPFSTGDQHSPAANTAAVVTYAAAGADRYHVITGVRGSIAATAPLTTSTQTLKIEDGSGNVVFEQPLEAQATGASQVVNYVCDVKFTQPKRGAANTALIITVPTGGAGNYSKVSVYEHWVEDA